MALTLTQDGVSSHLALEGAVTIAEAAKLKAMLMEAHASGLGLQIDLGQARELDVCVLQLLWCAERQWRLAEWSFALQEPVPDEVLAAFADAGMEPLRAGPAAETLCEG
jgi:hypothetical protein